MADLFTTPSRNINGTFTTPSYLVPSNASIPENIWFYADMSDNGRSDSGKSFTFEIQVSLDNISWRHTASFTYVGMPLVDATGKALGMPSLYICDGAYYKGKYVRAVITTSGQYRISFRVSTE